MIRALLIAAALITPANASAQPSDGAVVETLASPCVPSRRVRCPTPLELVAAANDDARLGPTAGAFVEARAVYPYAPGAIYELYASPGFVSMILLEPGESINAIAAGDTSRWMVTESETASETEPRAVVLVKPQAAGLRTNVAIITNRRTYLVEARSNSGASYTAEIAWSYPEAVAVSAPTGVESLDFRYTIRTVRGRRPTWLPVRVYNDGRRTLIDFPSGVVAADLPPLFVITPEGAELVNYRVEGQRYVVDRLFDAAELRLGVRAPIVVRIDRGDRPPRRPQTGGRR
ncbi:MAG: P-type conjugative transfer protein TrbG [Hyphomonadaceae bacterium]|nr:P-type conjugative transfer protein TrbG [Hyphomonadaceae bacterium]